MPLLPLAQPVPGVRRLAVLRSGGLGDLILAEPALAALRAAYPGAELTLLGAEHHRALVQGRDGPWDVFSEVPLIRGVRLGDAPDAGPAQVEAWCEQQRSRGYDLAVQMHGGGRFSNPLVLRLGARVTAGTATPDAVLLDRTVPYAFNQHETLRWLEVAAACGAPPVRLEPALAGTAEDRAAGDALLPPGLAPSLVVHPGATAPRRRWPPARWAAVADRLAAQGARVVVVGGPGDASLVAAVAAAMRTPVRPVAPPTLPALLGVLARATLLLGNDSGPRHLAHALGVPTVSVSTAANLADVAPLLRTWHRVLVGWGSVCPVCRARDDAPDCGHEAAGVMSVGVEEVTQAALALWTAACARGGSRVDPAHE